MSIQPQAASAGQILAQHSANLEEKRTRLTQINSKISFLNKCHTTLNIVRISFVALAPIAIIGSVFATIFLSAWAIPVCIVLVPTLLYLAYKSVQKMRQIADRLFQARIIKVPIELELNSLNKNLLTSTCKANNLTLLEALLSKKDLQITREDKFAAVEASIINNSLSCLKCLLKDQDILLLDKQKALIIAAEKNKTECLKELFTSCSMSIDAMGSALEHAAKKGSLAALQELYQTGVIDVAHKEAALKSALCHGSFECYQFLIDQGVSLGDLQHKETLVLLKHAAEQGNKGAMNIALGQRTTPKLSSSDINEALLLAAEKGHLSCVEMLIEKLPAFEATIPYSTVVGCIKGGYANILKKLLENPRQLKISDTQQYLQEASKAGSFECLRELIKQTEISYFSYNFQAAVREAIKQRSLACLEALLKAYKGPPINQYRGEWVIEAAKSGDIDCMRLICNGAYIEPRHLDAAFSEAAKNGHARCLEFLNTKNPIPDPILTVCIKQSAEKGHLAAINYLLTIRAIPNVVRGDAYRIAQRYGHLEIANILLASGDVRERSPGLFQDPVDRLYIKLDSLPQGAVHYLKDIELFGQIRSIRFVSNTGAIQDGIDAGGLTKNFISKLIDAIDKQKLIQLDAQRIPTIQDKATEETYRLIGKLFSAIDEKNVGRTDPLYTGSLFSQQTYSLLTTLIDPYLTEKQKLIAFVNLDKTLAAKPIVEFLNKVDPSEEDIDDIRDYLCNTMGIIDEEDDLSLEELQNTCLIQYREGGAYKSIRSIALGLSASLTQKFRNHGAYYGQVIQGADTFTTQEILLKLHYTDARLNQKMGWIRKKITEEMNKPDSTWVKRFLICVTGQSVLPKENIDIQVATNLACSVSTCYNILRVPVSNHTPHIDDPTLSEEERFIRNLEITMSQIGFDAQ